jgi:hypothetical protein
MFTRKTVIITLCVLVTLANGGVLGYALTKKTSSTSKAVILKKNDSIKNAELTTIDKTKTGKLLGTGQYTYTALDQSKMTQGDPAQLVVATESKSNSHYVLALIGQDTKIPADKINDGWSVASIAQDRMWAPGACSSKPTFLIQGKYIFIDDGKTNPDDKYNSYIVFNMATGKYNYFGGNSFTKDQGGNEMILKSLNENDKLVFYIDPVDSSGPLAGNTEGKHARGRDHAYIIRREIDPATMKYADYSLPYSVPAGVSVYSIALSYNDGMLISLTPDGSQTSYDGKVADNQITLAKAAPYGVIPSDQQLDSQLELSLDSILSSAMPNLSKQTPYSGAPAYKAKFGVEELGSNKSVKFLIAKQRFGGYSVPTVYNQSIGSVNPMTDSLIFESYVNYVPLGVF